jgi:hypothetical protein
MGHASKEKVWTCYGEYVAGLELDAGQIREYYINDYR